MAATKPGKNTALAALTSAALSLPGLSAEAAVPVSSMKTNVSYGHYQESDNRMQVDIYHADVIIPLSERLEFAFSIDRDTYSGATPTFSMPESLANLPKYKQKTDGTPSTEVSHVDLISAASGGVTAAGLTILGGLNGFQSFADGTTVAQSEISTNKDLAITQFITLKDAGLNAIETTIAATQVPLTAQFVSDQTLRTDKLLADKTNLLTQYNADAALINPGIPSLNATHAIELANLDAAKAAAEAAYLASNPRPVVDSIASAVTINFNKGESGTPTVANPLVNGQTFANPGMTQSAYSGFANNTPIAGGSCAGTGASGCYYEDGMVVGIVQDTSDPISHLHREGTSAGPDTSLKYHSDSSGIYIRALNSQAFSLQSMGFSALIGAENPIYGANPTHDVDGIIQPDGSGVLGPNENWVIWGYSSAVNPNLDTSVNCGGCIAQQTVANGFSGTVTLSSAFNNIKAFWIHYNGYQQSPLDGRAFAMQLDNINIAQVITPTAEQTTWDSALQSYRTTYSTTIYAPTLTSLTNTYNTNLAALTTTQSAEFAALKVQYDAKLATLAAGNTADQTVLTSHYNAQVAALSASYATQRAEISTTYATQVTQQNAISDEQAKQAAIALYGSILNSLIPTGTPTVQRFSIQPQETRTMPQFNAKYYFDATTLTASGGLSDEPDFLSNFGSTNISHEFNDKLTTVSAGYGLTSNTISRNGSGHSAHSGAGHEHYGPTNYPALNATSTFHNLNASIAQVLSKNTLFQSSASFTQQSGYLSNPYKYVYVRGEVTPAEYYQMYTASETVNWNSITNLEMVGTELFREKRPNQRNIFSVSNGLNQHIPALNASVHFDYRYYADDWGIDSHTLELKWFQSLPWGLTVTPGIRYYSQSQADFFAPYFLAPRADGNYSSDFRLSAFGDLSSGLTISKEFARGIKLEMGAEYVTHSGSLKLGGGGVGDYADFNYYLAHANLNVDLGARAFSGGEHANHHTHHHGAPVPAGVMYGHMMNQADEIMVGYRYQYSSQSGAMLHGSDTVSDQSLVANACAGFTKGCIYKPASMNMHMHMLDLMYAPTDWLNVMLMPQLMSMDMTMSNTLRTLDTAETSANLGAHGGAKHVSNDLGDTVVTALVKVLDKNDHHVHAGLGISAPTGRIDADLSGSQLVNTGSTKIDQSSITLQDYGMQTGSGTWDFKPSLTYTGQVNDWSWGAQISGVKRLQKNKYGYAYGDIFQTTGWGSYQLFTWLSASVRGVYTAQNQIRGESTQTHQTTATVDYPSNYGGRFADVGLGLNAMIPGGQFAGHNLSLEWLQPVSTDYNGYQLDRNGTLAVNWNYAF